MLFKEKGYDEFLAQKIQQGQTDSREGRVLTLEESKARTQRVFEQKLKEIEQANLSEEFVNYG